jgi:hypothetical protein
MGEASDGLGERWAMDYASDHRLTGQYDVPGRAVQRIQLTFCPPSDRLGRLPPRVRPHGATSVDTTCRWQPPAS